MKNPGVVVVGAGISGLSFAWKAAQAGCNVLVLEQRERIGGCIYSCRYDDGYWYELGAHTVYNSYSALLDIVVEAGLSDKLVQRGPARVHFGLLHSDRIDWLTPPKVLLRLNWFEAALHAPLGFFRGKRNRSVEQYYSGLLGPGNFRRILSPFFAAVPSQCADGFPVEGPGSLFKKRSRRKEFPRSFGLQGGLQTICDAVSAHPNIEFCTRTQVTSVLPLEGGFEISMGDGTRVRAPCVAVAATQNEAVALLKEGFPKLSAVISRMETVSLESLGSRIARNKCWLPECAFVVPVHDTFFSAVTRDPFPDPNWRAFAFHFRPGLSRKQKIDRICALLRVSETDLDGLTEQATTLPAPQINHMEVVAGIQQQIPQTGLALMGNYFTGLAIEDCIQRANSEWNRLQSSASSIKEQVKPI
jgi:oxygen-dependent protoporphyrinogen oxidase